MANSLPSTEYWAVRHRSHYSTRQCTVSRVFLLLAPNLSRRKGGATQILSCQTKGGMILLPSPCIVGPQEGQSPILDTCKKHYFPEITCTRSGPNHDGACRTAPATPGLLIKRHKKLLMYRNPSDLIKALQAAGSSRWLPGSCSVWCSWVLAWVIMASAWPLCSSALLRSSQSSWQSQSSQR